MGLFKKFFDPGRKELKLAKQVADKVFLLEDEMKSLTDQQLQLKTDEFKKRYAEGETLDDLMVEAFAVVREASTRKLHMTPYHVQVMGAVAIHRGNIAEMKTGEGKTLTSVMPAYLNALNSKGVHIVTVNEYLATREAEGEIGDLFRFLGLTVGLNLRTLTREQKQAAYDCDIMYSTHSELGFDYLRDHMVLYAKDMVAQRGLQYAIVDEVDSILIDEARTPLIISGGAKNDQNLYERADRFAKSLRDEDYEIDIESKSIELRPSGIERAENIFQVGNLYDLEHVTLVHHINNALKANYTMSRDIDYVVQNDSVQIVDQFTGRVLVGRQFSEGLHQALEAKEQVTINKETITVATITYQNFFRMYPKLSGMTGTAKTEEEEFKDIYKMVVVEVPTNKPVIRKDENDLIFATMAEKYEALVNEIEARHQLGQPILVGTISIESSEYLSTLLRKRRIPHELLNAKQHEREADIVAKAGQQKAVTIATNMAGRGTDIKLGEGVVEVGGLAVLGSERHESRRIDNQLRGRGGRQGDPGFSQFFISAEDELMVRFAGDTFKNRLEMILRISGSRDALNFKVFSRFILNAQKRIESINYDIRKNVLKYDDVIRMHREIIYRERTDVIKLDNITDQTRQMIEKHLRNFISTTQDQEHVLNTLNTLYFGQNTFDESFKDLRKEEQIELVLEMFDSKMKEKQEAVPEEIFNEFLKIVMLRVIDTHWIRHIDEMSALRQGVSLQAYGQENPLVIYQKEALEKFNRLIESISKDVTMYTIRGQIRYNVERTQVVKNTATNEGREDKKPKKNKPKVNRYQRNLPWR